MSHPVTHSRDDNHGYASLNASDDATAFVPS